MSDSRDNKSLTRHTSEPDNGAEGAAEGSTLFRTLTTGNRDAQAAYTAIQEVQAMAGRNVMTAIAQFHSETQSTIAQFHAETQSTIAQFQSETQSAIAGLGARIDSVEAKLGARIDKVEAAVKATNSRIDSFRDSLKSEISALRWHLAALSVLLVSLIGWVVFRS